MKKIGYKKVKQLVNGKAKVRILKLEILGQVIVPYRNCGGLKKRTSRVRVLAAYSVRESVSSFSIFAKHRLDKELKAKGPYVPYHFHCDITFGFQYFVGKIAVPAQALNKAEDMSCGSGIHFFSTLKEALAYNG